MKVGFSNFFLATFIFFSKIASIGNLDGGYLFCALLLVVATVEFISAPKYRDIPASDSRAIDAHQIASKVRNAHTKEHGGNYNAFCVLSGKTVVLEMWSNDHPSPGFIVKVARIPRMKQEIGVWMPFLKILSVRNFGYQLSSFLPT